MPSLDGASVSSTSSLASEQPPPWSPSDPSSLPVRLGSASLSSPPPSKFAILSLHRRSCLRFVQFPQSIYGPDAMGPVLATSWPHGIEKQGFYGPSFEYQLKGQPFGTGEKESVASRRLIRDLLAYLYERGWLLETAFTNTRRVGAKDSLLFRRSGGAEGSATPPPPPVDWLVITTNKWSRLRLIYDAEHEVPGSAGQNGVAVQAAAANGFAVVTNEKGGRRGSNVPPSPAVATASSASGSRAGSGDLAQLVGALKTAMEQMDYFQGGEWSEESLKFTIKGNPWRARHLETVKMRQLILRVVETLDSFGWRVYGTIRQRQENGDYRKGDTWYFVRAKDWVPGSPFNGEPLPVSLFAPPSGR